MALGGRATILLSEGRWFDSPGLHVDVSFGKILNPKTAHNVQVGTLHGSHRHQCMNVCMNYCKSLWTNWLLNALNVNVFSVSNLLRSSLLLANSIAQRAFQFSAAFLANKMVYNSEQHAREEFREPHIEKST